MSDGANLDPPNTNRSAAGPPDEADRLLERYGTYLEAEDMTVPQMKDFLLALSQIMRAFVEIGFSVKSGDKFHPDCDLGMDDVLQYLIPEETAHETVASPNTNNNEEQP